VTDRPQASSEKPSGPTEEPASDELQPDALSAIAREAVRQPADPRIDAHLARMGLTGDEVPVKPRPSPAVGSAPEPLTDLTPRVDELRATIVALEAKLDAASTRLGLLAAALLAVAVVAVIALVLALR
jgi:hypothetical protein